MTVKNINEAWAKVNEIFPTDYSEDVAASERAGYKIYRSSINHYDYICDLGDRLEINFSDDTTVNIWVETEEVEEVKTVEKKEMIRTKDYDGFYKTKNIHTALNRFSKKYPCVADFAEFDEFKEEAIIPSLPITDKYLSDGTINNEWSYYFNIDVQEDGYYIWYIERAKKE